MSSMVTPPSGVPVPEPSSTSATQLGKPGTCAPAWTLATAGVPERHKPMVTLPESAGATSASKRKL